MTADEASAPAGADRSRDQRFADEVLPELEVLYRVARRITGDGHDAEDVVQETLIRAYRAIDRFDGRYPRSWLLTILRNVNRSRFRRRRPDLLDDEDRTFAVLAADGADGRDGPAETVAEGMPDPRLVAALGDLSTDHRAVIAMVDVEGLSYAETAEVLGIPVGTVMSRLHRARTRLRRRLVDDGVVVPPTADEHRAHDGRDADHPSEEDPR